ncbi:MAG: hypothetical protein HYX68_13345 [Planctomycetes bacterium]|nr:hypothetical protein [Planctomycetota bacterium]
MKRITILALGLSLGMCVHLVFAGGEILELGGLKSKVPEGWKKQKPVSRLRKAQFALPKAKGDKEDADLAIFGGIGGSAEANIERWKMLFIPPEGKTLAEASKLDKYSIGKVAEVVVFDISGTYLYRDPSNPNAKQERKENFRRINVILSTDKDSVVITLAGPANTVAKHKAAFDGWIKAFK